MKNMRKWVMVLAVLLLLPAAGWYLLPVPPPLDEVSWSQRVLDRDGNLLRVTLSADDRLTDTPWLP